MSLRTTKETREVIRALGALAARVMRARADGVWSTGEKLSFMGDLPEVWVAVQNIDEVPAELEDLDDVERAVLLEAVKKVMIRAGVSHRDSDAAERILEWAYTTAQNTVELWRAIRDAPPVALAVDIEDGRTRG
jgi:hypothetical protein